MTPITLDAQAGLPPLAPGCAHTLAPPPARRRREPHFSFAGRAHDDER